MLSWVYQNNTDLPQQKFPPSGLWTDIHIPHWISLYWWPRHRDQLLQRILYEHNLGWNLDPSSNVPWQLSDNSEEYAPYHSWLNLVRRHQPARREVSVYQSFSPAENQKLTPTFITNAKLESCTSWLFWKHYTVQGKNIISPQNVKYSPSQTHPVILWLIWGIWQRWDKYHEMLSLWFFFCFCN